MSDDDLVKQLREVRGNKLDYTNTPNHLRLTAAARIEELEAENAKLRAAYATPPADLTSPNPWKGEKEC
jgi:hypothetical protein